MPETLLVRGGTILTMNRAREILRGDVLVEDGAIAAVGAVDPRLKPDALVDARDGVILPGFVQGHVHLCQTLFRNCADDLPLLEWLRRRIWPLEAAHDEKTTRAAARLGLFELIEAGVTSVLDMGSVRHYEAVFDEAGRAGLRLVGGKAMMDDDAGGTVPEGLRESTRASVDASVALAAKWHGAAGGRLRYAFAPRFALSSTPDLHREATRQAAARDALVHTHASENAEEVAAVFRRFGKRNVSFLADLGVLEVRSAIAHAVHLEAEEFDRLRGSRAGVVHCPASNLKLASGIADVPRIRATGAPVGLGSDGAACNNRLDPFRDMFLAASLAKVRHGADALPAWEVLEMATIEGARAIGLEGVCGSIEVGKRADLVVLRLGTPWTVPAESIASAIVYAADPRNVEAAICDGEILKERGRVLPLDGEEVVARAREAWGALTARAAVS
ncbi:MAG TPA: amidohydrolase family protein [Planctomycetota bacterium]|nr:amidohydrolase family protein [Planctomycetota bacterium]